MSRKQSRIGSRQQNENTIHQSKSPLLIKTDEKPPQVTVYTLGQVSTHSDESTQTDDIIDDNTKSISPGKFYIIVVAYIRIFIYISILNIKESSMILPISPPNIRQREKIKPHTVGSPVRRYVREQPIHLPPIAPKNYPYKYMHARPSFYHYQNFNKPPPPSPPPPPPPPLQQRRQVFYQYNYGPTYDPRWWYMPVNTVHGPRTHHQYIPPNQYRPPKWYQLPTR